MMTKDDLKKLIVDTIYNTTFLCATPGQCHNCCCYYGVEDYCQYYKIADALIRNGLVYNENKESNQLMNENIQALNTESTTKQCSDDLIIREFDIPSCNQFIKKALENILADSYTYSDTICGSTLAIKWDFNESTLSGELELIPILSSVDVATHGEGKKLSFKTIVGGWNRLTTVDLTDSYNKVVDDLQSKWRDFVKENFLLSGENRDA